MERHQENTLTNIIEQFNAGDSVFIAGASSEPRPFVEELNRLASTLPAIEIVHSFLPGVNTVPLATEDNALLETTVFPRPSTGKINIIPATYYSYQQYLHSRNFDWTIVQLSPRGENGQHCLGASVEFMPTVLKKSKRVVGLINPHIPVIKGSYFINESDIDIFCEMNSPLISYDAGSVDPVSRSISENVAQLIEDGSTLQLGLGKVPTKLIASLVDRRNLRFHTGLLTPGFIDLQRAGAIDPNYTHTTCACLGDAEFYHQLSLTNNVRIAGVDYTHLPERLGGLSALITVNSALEVDVTGQANLEYKGSRKISSAGGAPDFATAASQSKTGKSIIALPSTAAKGTISRIQKQLDPSRPASLSANLVDYIVTEYGIAHLTGKSDRARAEAMAEIAAPEFRGTLL